MKQKKNVTEADILEQVKTYIHAEDSIALIEKAMATATRMHEGQFRKSGEPYIIHPFQVGYILAQLQTGPSTICAGLLHDVLEDTDYTAAEIEEQFGKEVARLVESETENKYHDRPKADTWKIRKEETIHHLRHASLETKMITLGDKLSNIRSIKRDYEQLGNQLWERFNQRDPQMHAWYYRSICQSLTELEDSAAWKELDCLIKEVFNY